MEHSWGYSTENGPQVWKEKFPLANGIRQSPVNIVTSATRTDNDLTVNPLRWNYVADNVKCLLNPGYCWRVDIKGAGSELTGGPLNNDKYVVEQFHCHWGCSNGRGSEHTVDGTSFSGELHIVHWNSSKYDSFAHAAGHPDGLAVLGVFMKVGEHHEELDKIAKLMPFIMHKGDRVTLNSLDPGKFLPKDNKAYYTYEGSLTTPPFNESVQWILFKEPMYLSQEQLQAFRDLRSHDVNEECPEDMNWLVYDNIEEVDSNIEPGKIVNNFRPPLELGNRELREAGEH